jgi:predicted P-loop ATPase
MQMKKVNYRKCFKAYYSDLPRIASFIGTSNEKSLLTDETGSRRFLCMEVEKPIDCSPIDYPQLYAQLKWELEAGKRYWLSKEEELEIQEHNQDFYKQSTEEEVFFKVFRLPKEGEPFVRMTASSIFDLLQKRYPALMRSANVRQFGKVLCHIGAKKSRSNMGSVYEVVLLGRMNTSSCSSGAA